MHLDDYQSTCDLDLQCLTSSEDTEDYGITYDNWTPQLDQIDWEQLEAAFQDPTPSSPSSINSETPWVQTPLELDYSEYSNDSPNENKHFVFPQQKLPPVETAFSFSKNFSTFYQEPTFQYQQNFSESPSLQEDQNKFDLNLIRRNPNALALQPNLSEFQIELQDFPVNHCSESFYPVGHFVNPQQNGLDNGYGRVEDKQLLNQVILPINDNVFLREEDNQIVNNVDDVKSQDFFG